MLRNIAATRFKAIPALYHHHTSTRNSDFLLKRQVRRIADCLLQYSSREPSPLYTCAFFQIKSDAPLTSPAVGLNESYSAAYSFSSSPGAVMTDGPLKTLNRFEADADKHAELELHDPIARPMLTQAEAHVIFKL